MPTSAAKSDSVLPAAPRPCWGTTSKDASAASILPSKVLLRAPRARATAARHTTSSSPVRSCPASAVFVITVRNPSVGQDGTFLILPLVRQIRGRASFARRRPIALQLLGSRAVPEPLIVED